jgi:thiosulfate dehydrogenase
LLSDCIIGDHEGKFRAWGADCQMPSDIRDSLKFAFFAVLVAIVDVSTAVAFTPPPESAIPNGPLGDSVRRGEAIFTATHKYAGPFVGNNLNCSNCHLDRGRKAGSIPMWGAWPLYPQFRTKNGKVNTMALRIQECFLYSMNGKKPPADSDVVTDLQSYFAWLATGAPTGATLPGASYPALPTAANPPDEKRGALLFAKSCVACHGPDGQGNVAGGIPPLWGPQSYNGGAGMHEVEKAARFIRANMPLGQEGTLAPDQARDIAAYIDSRPRPADPRSLPPKK